MKNNKKLNQPQMVCEQGKGLLMKRKQIEDLAALYQCSTAWVGSVCVVHNDKPEWIGGAWQVRKWSRDEWRNTFERITNTKTAELWNKARGGGR